MTEAAPTLDPIRTAVIGFGTGGRVFHAPLIDADPAFRLDLIVTADPERQRQARSTYPQSRVVGTADELFDAADELDLVVVSTPPDSHRDLALSALERDLAVVVDKPFVVDPAHGRELMAEAAARDLLLTVFHNRRHDGDFGTLQKLADEGILGEIHSLESRFEWFKPEETKAWKAYAGPEAGGGMLFDLGPHLIDQARLLFGPISSAYAELTRYRSGEGGDDEAFVSLEHESGVRTHAVMSSMASVERPRFSLVGSDAGYFKMGLDVQESQLGAGMSPLADGYGVDPRDRWGRIERRGDSEPVRQPTERGRYGDFYAGVAAAWRSESPPPVDPADALAVIELIDHLYATTEIRHR